MQKKKISRAELVELRKKEQARKEMEVNIKRSMKEAHKKIEDEERLFVGKQMWVIRVFNFLGTLTIFYMIISVARRFTPPPLDSNIIPALQIIGLTISIASLFLKKSILDIFINKLAGITD